MNKLSDILALPKQKGDFGIEIEVEGRNLPEVDTPYWKTEPDGSLRNGKEYIFKRPYLLKTVPALLRALNKQFEQAEAKLEFSFRTSVHVHMNMQELSYHQVLNTIYTYLLLEAPLMEFCGESRKGNRFCLRMEDAEGLVGELQHLFSTGEYGLHKIGRDRVRYASINIEALKKYGSLEFRALAGTADVDRITTWCTALSNIRDFACTHNSPSDIFNLFADIEAEAFQQLVLKGVAPAFEYPGMVKDIQRSFSLAIDLPFAYAQSEELKKTLKKFPGDADLIIMDELE